MARSELAAPVGDRRFWRNRKVAVTGATGFLGSHLTGMLVERGADVVVLVRDDVPVSPVALPWWPEVAVVRGRCEDQAIVERLLGDYEVRSVFHLAAQSQVGAANRNPVATFESNVAGTWAVLEAARRSPLVEQIVTASSDKAYGEQPSLPYSEGMPLLADHPYDVSKACADMVAQSFHRTYDLPVTITRCGNFFGPGDRNWERLVPSTVRSLLQGVAPVIRSDGTLVRDYLFVRDGALAYLVLAEAMATDPGLHGEAFNFSIERPMSVLELVEVIQEAVGVRIPPDIRREAGHEISRQYLSAAKARDRLAWSPATSFEDAMSETVEWYRAYLAGDRTPAVRSADAGR